jgi:putative redox protein
LQVGEGMDLSAAAPVGKLALAWNRCQCCCRIGNKRCDGWCTGKARPGNPGRTPWTPTPKSITQEELHMAQEVHVQVKQISASTSECVARQFKTLSDRPEAKGGSDRGPMGGEMLLMGLGGCFMSNLLAAVKTREAAVSDIAIAVTATLADAPARFSAVKLAVSGNYPDKAEMEKLVTIAERSCIVANTLKGAVQLSFEVV